LDAPTGSTLVAIGNFDGVHRGHQAVLRAASELARARGLTPVVLTFHPHPAEVLGRGKQAVLTPLSRKLELLTELFGELRVVVEPFTRALSKMGPEQFAKELLASALGAKVVLVGDNFRFGKGRAGDVAALTRLGKELGFEAETHALEGDDSGAFSSTRIRAAVAAGEMDEAARLLGRPHALTGLVAHGDQRGRTIGFPTANLVDIEELMPPHGVYACMVRQAAGELVGKGVVNIGTRPTVGAGYSVEAHVLDYSGDLYEHLLRLDLIARLRAEQRFSGVAELAEQIGRDVEAARQILADR
jgi:riboflavin kinase/FMN adenylyltransferase